MSDTSVRDPELAALAAALGLRHAHTPEEWRRNTLARLGQSRYEQLQARRASLAANPGSEEEFYEFVTADPDRTLAMLEGRLGYYEALLPRVAAEMANAPHARILDLGSYGGLVSLSLGKRFPDATIIGIDRCAGAVERSRIFLKAVGLPNVEFVHGDYTRYVTARSFDVVLSFQTTPTYLLPQVPSESPETYQRGKNLATALSDPAFPGRPVAEAITSMRRLAGERGRVFLQERLPDLSRALVFQELVGRAGLAVLRTELLAWQTANEREGVQRSPLFVGQPQSGTAPADEQSLIDLLLPPPKSIDPSRLGRDQPAALAGPDAQWAFHALAGAREEACVRGASRDRHGFHIHLGVLGGERAYVYTCTTSDYRELKICAATYTAMLFQPVVEQLRLRQQAGEISVLDPQPEALAGILRAKFAAFGLLI